MANNWDRFDEAEDLPYFTVEERARIDRVFDEMQERYDPVGARQRKLRYFKYGRAVDARDVNKKVRDAEDAAGWPRSNPS